MKRVSFDIDNNKFAYNKLLDLIKEYLGEEIDNILINEVEK